jgi:hypothetical protein
MHKRSQKLRNNGTGIAASFKCIINLFGVSGKG